MNFITIDFKTKNKKKDSTCPIGIDEELKCEEINEMPSRLPSPKNEIVFKWMESAPLKNEVVVFTGKLTSMTRNKAISIVKKLGGTVGSSVTRKTTILVTNMKNVKNLRREEMSNKFRRATDLIARGQNIRFLNEEEFLSL